MGCGHQQCGNGLFVYTDLGHESLRVDRGIGIGMDRAVAPAVDVVDFCAGFCVRIYSLGGRDFPCDGMGRADVGRSVAFRFGRWKLEKETLFAQ